MSTNNQIGRGIISLILNEVYNDVWFLVYEKDKIQQDTQKYSAIKSLKFVDFSNEENERYHDETYT